MIDLEKLTPLPAVVKDHDFEEDACGFAASVCHPDEEFEAALFFEKDDAEFYLLARNAFDVMMRRGWYPRPHFGKWRAHGADGYMGDEFPDPFTALVETDKWYKENVEKK